ncbi:MAG: hypothetical protein ACPG5W_06700 [Flavobacteriales bacterium]
MSSGLPSMFKSPKNRSFDYKPWFYDEQKERKEKLERRVEEHNTGEISDERRLQRLRGNLGRNWSTGDISIRKKDSVARNIRLLIVFAVLIGIIALIYSWGA